MATHTYQNTTTCPPSWSCVVCLEENPDELIQHNFGGEKHPIHRNCAIAWHSKKIECPTCRLNTEIDSLFPLHERCKIIACKYIDQTKNWMIHPINQFKMSMGLITTGIAYQKYPVVALGFALQAFTIHLTLKYGSPDLRPIRKIQNLAKELIQNPNQKDKIKELQKLIPHLNLKNLEAIEKGMRYKIYGDNFVRFLRANATIAAAFFTFMSVKKFKGKVLASPFSREIVFMKMAHQVFQPVSQ
ncbi:MAG: hypothetical protein COT85_01150 [Chlamydiae bacterium CG10_big_fil_rev_8_21_14_0_10_42_34]|nr:MAG: hypothetical protein COT85_01150 [Chlamydiae bacterium CG10_big_fil_rev_8_21_14_0_10_42_34]